MQAEKPVAKAKTLKVKKSKDSDPTSKPSASSQKIEKSAEEKAKDLAKMKNELLKRNVALGLRNQPKPVEADPNEKSSSSLFHPSEEVEMDEEDREEVPPDLVSVDNEEYENLLQTSGEKVMDDLIRPAKVRSISEKSFNVFEFPDSARAMSVKSFKWITTKTCKG